MAPALSSELLTNSERGDADRAALDGHRGGPPTKAPLKLSAPLGALLFFSGLGCGYLLGASGTSSRVSVLADRPAPAEELVDLSGDGRGRSDSMLTAENCASRSCFGVGKWSELAEPWVNESAGDCCEDLGVDQLIPLTYQWVCAGAVWIGCLAWFLVCLLRKGEESALERWGPPALILVGFATFFGFVSPEFNPFKCAGFLANFVLLFWSARNNATVPFLAGVFCGPCFLYPVDAAIGQGLVNYDFNSYAISVGWTTGISNSLTYVMKERGYISDRLRWPLQSLGWPLLMSGFMIYEMLTSDGGESSYKLNLCQVMRYFAFQMSLYVFIYYGVCRWVEQATQKDGAKADVVAPVSGEKRQEYKKPSLPAESK